MKLVTYQSGDGPRVGALEEGGVVDLGFDGDMVAFIEAGAPEGPRSEVGEARLLAPLRPRSLRDFLAFEGHLKGALGRLGREIPDEWYEVPAYYKGMPDTVIGPDDEIPWPSWTDHLDHELELAAVVGRRCRDVSAAEAADVIFGYTIWNDVSARDVQTRELPIGMGPGKAKDWDGSNVLGPCLVTADELDAGDLRMSVRVNGETWGRTRAPPCTGPLPTCSPTPRATRRSIPARCSGRARRRAARASSSTAGCARATWSSSEIDGIGTLSNRIAEQGRGTEWLTWYRRCGGPTRERRTASHGSARR